MSFKYLNIVYAIYNIFVQCLQFEGFIYILKDLHDLKLNLPA